MPADTLDDSPLDYAAFDAAPLQRGAFDYLVLAQFIRPEALSAAARDFPDITDEASYRPDELDLRGGFKAVIDALDSDRFRHAIERKCGVDLEGCPTSAFAKASAEGRGIRASGYDAVRWKSFRLRRKEEAQGQ